MAALPQHISDKNCYKYCIVIICTRENTNATPTKKVIAAEVFSLFGTV